MEPTASSSLSANEIRGEGRGEVALSFWDGRFVPKLQRGDIFVENQSKKLFQAP